MTISKPKNVSSQTRLCSVFFSLLKLRCGSADIREATQFQRNFTSVFFFSELDFVDVSFNFLWCHRRFNLLPTLAYRITQTIYRCARCIGITPHFDLIRFNSQCWTTSYFQVEIPCNLIAYKNTIQRFRTAFRCMQVCRDLAYSIVSKFQKMLSSLFLLQHVLMKWQSFWPKILIMHRRFDSKGIGTLPKKHFVFFFSLKWETTEKSIWINMRWEVIAIF